MGLLALADLFRRHWATVAAKTAVTLGDVEEAELLGDRIYTAGGAIRRRAQGAAEAQQVRDQAFAYFREAYEATRRVAVFVRGKAGAAEILPNVFDWRRGRRRKGAAEEG